MLFFPSINISECCWIVYPVCVCVCERRCFCKCVCVFDLFLLQLRLFCSIVFFVSLSNIYISLLHLLGFLYNRFTNLVSFNELFCFFFLYEKVWFFLFHTSCTLSGGRLFLFIVLWDLWEIGKRKLHENACQFGENYFRVNEFILFFFFFMFVGTCNKMIWNDEFVGAYAIYVKILFW